MTVATPEADQKAVEDLAPLLNDVAWRLSNLYWIIVKQDDDDGDGLVMRFKPNPTQRRLMARMHTRNVICKARQLGMCLDPSTRVLTADLRWVPIADLQAGDRVVAVDEECAGGKGTTRYMRTADVQAVVHVEAPAYRITFDDGRSVVCTDWHPWLSRAPSQKHWQWRSIDPQPGQGSKKRLKVGTQVRWVTKPWADGDMDDGWFGGMLDGEGSMALPSRNGASVSVSQVDGPVWNRLCSYAMERGYNARVEHDAGARPSKFGSRPVPKLAFTRMDELFRLVGQTRPTRFIGREFWEARALPGRRTGEGIGVATIVSIEPVGTQTMIDLQTSTGTYIAEGFVSHNTTLVSILWLDTALFAKQPIRCGIIAHEREAAESIFRDKVLFAYNRLPDQIKALCPIKSANKTEIVFAHNDASIRVATSMRSGTIHRLHVSELGKISRKYPGKAREVIAGSIPTVPSSGIVIIESTAEGEDGVFHDIAMRAEQLRQKRVQLSRMDYKIHFFAWWEDPAYTLDDAHQTALFDEATLEYFNRIEMEIGRPLSEGQRAWYVATRDSALNGDEALMWQEYPACISGDMLVGTADGIVPIRDAKVDGVAVLAHIHRGERDVYEVVTKLGYAVRCTSDHRIKLASGEFMSIDGGLTAGHEVALAPPSLSGAYQRVPWRPAPFVDGGIDITPEFAEFMGMFMGDGSFHNGTVSMVCDAQDADIVDVVHGMFDRFLGGSSSRVTGTKKGCIEVRKGSEWFSSAFLALGVIEHRAQGGLKRKVHVPDFIKRSPPDVVAAFLRGLFEADGFASRDGCCIKFFSKHLHVVRDVQLLLLALGIESRASSLMKKSGSDHPYLGHELALRASGVRKFAVGIGFLSARKQQRAEMSLGKKATGSAAGFAWSDKVVSVAPAGRAPVYDLTTSTHEFDAGGVVVHNCLSEAFKASTEGCYYTAQLTSARRQQRIRPIIPIETGVPVYSFWDLGRSDYTAIWLMQKVGPEHRFIWYYENSGEELDHYAKWLQDRGVLYARHYLPHDADIKRLGERADTNRTLKESLESLLPGHRVDVVPRVSNVMSGIQSTRSALASCWFHETNCVLGMARLAGYRKTWDRLKGCWKDEPLHNEASHGCLVGESLVLTFAGPRRIDTVTVGDMVWTPGGWARVTAAGISTFTHELLEIVTDAGHRLVCTPEHRVFSSRGVHGSDALRLGDDFFRGDEWPLRLMSCFSRVFGIGFRRAITGEDRQRASASDSFTAPSGSSATGRFWRAWSSITETVIRATTASAIWSCFRSPSIIGCTSRNSGIGARADPEFLRERVDRNSRWHRSEEGRAAASRLNAKNRAAGKYEGHDKSAFYAGRDRWAASPECAEFNRQHALRLHAEGKVPPPSEECRQRAAEWHRSDEGRAWHREHGVATWANRKLSSVACVVCGGAFDTPYPTRAKFCSSSCKYQAAKARSAGAGV
jgi:intein/homing endonuclease